MFYSLGLILKAALRNAAENCCMKRANDKACQSQGAEKSFYSKLAAVRAFGCLSCQKIIACGVSIL